MIAKFLRPPRDWIAAKLFGAARLLATDPGWANLRTRFGSVSMMGGLQSLQQRGLDPQRIIDGGACKGDWTALARRVFPSARILMIEPQEQHQEALNALCESLAPGIYFAPRLIGPIDQSAVTFTVLDDHSGGTGSSVLPENSDVPRHVVSIPMVTLDRLVESSGFGQPDFIKLDVQGYELAVLEGAPRCLSGAKMVLLEISLWPYNVGSPLAAEVMGWMDAHGFRPFDVFDLSRRAGDNVLVQMDVIFLRKDHALLQDVQTRFDK